jgi:hypothetical protein
MIEWSAVAIAIYATLAFTLPVDVIAAPFA